MTIEAVNTGPDLQPTRDVAVSLKGVTKAFGRGPVILDGISLEIAEGEFLCLLGASGCGKSTLLSIVAGLDEPTTGLVEVPGRRPGLMFQEPALFPWLTARQNVELALRLRGVTRGDRRAEAERLLNLVHLQDAGDKRVHELSGGMRQRVAMARAFAQDSRVLLMDEPFAALDAITRDSLHDELVRLRTQLGLTVIFVTHNVREAVRLGDRVILMSSRPGRVAREYTISIPQPRRIEAPEVAAVALQITDDLREEIRRYGQH
jgi:NitT/TauT family transport system ATP-binding protein